MFVLWANNMQLRWSNMNPLQHSKWIWTNIDKHLILQNNYFRNVIIIHFKVSLLLIIIQFYYSKNSVYSIHILHVQTKMLVMNWEDIFMKSMRAI